MSIADQQVSTMTRLPLIGLGEALLGPLLAVPPESAAGSRWLVSTFTALASILAETAVCMSKTTEFVPHSGPQ